MAQKLLLPKDIMNWIIQLSDTEIGIFMKWIYWYVYQNIEPNFKDWLKYIFMI